ncbi:MAG: hypothetical protein IPL18_08805 [Sphingomonadales bacterium]|nr:hypothetical protein [Sphingomonadales bacterium]
MKKSTRILLLLILIEAGLAAIWLWLMHGISSGNLRPATSAADTASTVGSILGGAMGIVLTVFGLTWFVLRKREQEQ